MNIRDHDVLKMEINDLDIITATNFFKLRLNMFHDINDLIVRNQLKFISHTIVSPAA